MEMRHEQQPPDASIIHSRSNELVKLVRKLRWMGMEQEAERVLNELALQHATAVDSVLAIAGDTD